MTPTLALERLMLHPDYERFIQQVRQAAPVGLVDQADAAATEARAIFNAVAAQRCEAPTNWVGPGDLRPWLRLGLLDALTSWADGRASTCRHNPEPLRPEPVLAAAWRPGLIVCAPCAYLTALPSAGVRDRTCDACGRVCAGVEHGDGIYPGSVQLGSLIYLYGTCADCRPSMASENPLSATLPAEQTVPRGTGRARPRGQRGRRRGKGGRR